MTYRHSPSTAPSLSEPTFIYTPIPSSVQPPSQSPPPFLIIKCRSGTSITSISPLFLYRGRGISRPLDIPGVVYNKCYWTLKTTEGSTLLSSANSTGQGPGSTKTHYNLWSWLSSSDNSTSIACERQRPRPHKWTNGAVNSLQKRTSNRELDNTCVFFINGNQNPTDMLTKNLGSIKFLKYQGELRLEFLE